MEAAIIKVSSKGQIVIPASWRKSMNIKDGEGDVLMLKKIESSSLRDEFYNTIGPLRKKVKKLGLTREGLIDAIDEKMEMVENLDENDLVDIDDLVK